MATRKAPKRATAKKSKRTSKKKESLVKVSSSTGKPKRKKRAPAKKSSTKRAAKPTRVRRRLRKKRPSKAKTRKDIDANLRSIYKLDDARANVDMSRLEIVGQPIVRRLLMSILLILIATAAGLAGAMFLSNPLSQNLAQSLSFDIHSAESQLISGQEAVIQIPYHNTSSVPLAQLEITLHTPDSFVLLDAEPLVLDERPLQWTLGSLGPGDEGTLTVRGIFWGEAGEAATIQAITRYTPANVSSPFEDIVSDSLLVAQSAMAVDISGPAKAIPGEQQAYTVAVSQTSDATITDTELRLELPQGFEITDTDLPTIEEGKAAWALASLGPEETIELTITGQFASDVEGEQEVIAIIGKPLEERFVEQARVSGITNVLASELALSLVVNGEAGDSILLPGEDLTVNVALTNRGEEVAEDLTIELYIDQGLDRINLDGRSGIPDGDRYSNFVNWDGTDLTKLATLRGGEDVSIDVAIPSLETGSQTVQLRAIAQITSVGGIEINRELTSSTISVQVATDLQGSMSARYYDDADQPVGEGPMPPEIGSATTYRITWALTNALNDVTDVVMFAPLGGRADWAGLVSSTQGSVSYDSVADRVRWSVGSISAGSQPPTAVFDIRVTPTQADLNKFADLLAAGRVTAIDTVTDADLANDVRGITTELPNDPRATNEGLVQDPTAGE